MSRKHYCAQDAQRSAALGALAQRHGVPLEWALDFVNQAMKFFDEHAAGRSLFSVPLGSRPLVRALADHVERLYFPRTDTCNGGILAGVLTWDTLSSADRMAAITAMRPKAELFGGWCGGFREGSRGPALLLGLLDDIEAAVTNTAQGR